MVLDFMMWRFEF